MGQLREQLEDFGEHLGYDGKASHSTGQDPKDRGRPQTRRRTGGSTRREGRTAGLGKLWRKVKTWFGYRVRTPATDPGGLHAGLAVGGSMTEALFEETSKRSDFSADRGLTAQESLWDDPSVPWNPTRARNDHPVRTGPTRAYRKGAGCLERPMAFQGFEAARGTLYRCSAAAYGYTVPVGMLLPGSGSQESGPAHFSPLNQRPGSEATGGPALKTTSGSSGSTAG